MKRTPDYLHFFWAILVGAAMSACIPELDGSSKKPARKPWTPGPAPEGTGFDFKKNCGVDVYAETASIIYAQKLQSLNIVNEGEISLLNSSFRVEAMATLDIQSQRSSSSVEIDVDLKQVINKNTNSPPISEAMLQIGAMVTANAKAGVTVSTSLPTADWLKLTGGSDPEWKDMLCVATATKNIKVTSKGGNHDFEFTPGFASTINPMASPEQYKKELGSGRTFHITATVDRSNRTVNGTITFKPVAPTASFTDALTGKQYNIAADAAWEVQSEFDTRDNRYDQLSKTTIFYVNHTTKRFEAIVQKATPSMIMKVNPDVVLLPVQ